MGKRLRILFVLGIIVIAFGLVFWQKDKLFIQATCGYGQIEVIVTDPGGAHPFVMLMSLLLVPVVELFPATQI